MNKSPIPNCGRARSDQFRVGGGWWVGVLDGIKAILSPAGAWLWVELGNISLRYFLDMPEI